MQGKEAYPDDPPVEDEALLLRHEHVAVLLARHFHLKRRFVEIRIEFAVGAFFAGVEAFEAVLLERLHEDRFGHFEA